MTAQTRKSQQAMAQPPSLATMPVITEMARGAGVDAATYLASIRTLMPTPHTDAEIVICLAHAFKLKLDPLTGEIYFARDRVSGQIQAIAKVDGWITLINSHPQFDGWEFEELYDTRGQFTAIAVTVHRKDRKVPTTIKEHLAEARAYSTGAFVEKMPVRAVRNRAIAQAGKIVFGFGGLMEQGEYEAWQRAQAQAQAMADREARQAAVAPMDEIPDHTAPAPAAEPERTPEAAQPEAQGAAEEVFLLKFKAELEGITDEMLRVEFWDANASVIEKLSDSGQRRAQAIFEGRG